VWKRNPTLCQRLLEDILPAWKLDLHKPEHGLKSWRRIRRIVSKEFNESEPILAHVQSLVEKHPESEPPLTIVDLCSGFGICSLILSEILPPNKVSRIELVDKQFPSDAENLTRGKISVQHLTGRDWPIPLRYVKRNVNVARELQQIHDRDFDAAEGRIIIIGVHLCNVLSVRAIQLFLKSSKVDHLCLKPCCLPGKKILKDPTKVPIFWEFPNGFRFGPSNVYCMDVGLKEKNDSNFDDDESDPAECAAGGHGGGHGTKFFNCWVELLRRSCESSDVQVDVTEHEILENYILNKILFCRKVSASLPGATL